MGEAIIEIGDRTISPSATHVFALALHLATEAPRRISRTRLAELLFPGQKATAALHNLRQLLYRMRQLGVPLKSDTDFVSVDEQDVLDSVKLACAKRYPERRIHSPRGLTILPEYDPPTAPFSSWLEAYRDRQHRALVQSVSADLNVARRSGDWAAVQELASAVLELDVYHESATLCMAEAMARTGSKHRAVELLRRYEEDTSRISGSLSLPPQLLKKRIDPPSSSAPGAIPEAPLVGRKAEMSELAERWDHARAGNFSVVLVSGEPSIGKSRLVAEFVSIIRVDGTGSIVASRCLASDKLRPLSLFADLANQLLSLPGAAGCSPNHMPVLTGLSNLIAPSGGTGIPFTPNHDNTCNAVVELLECVSSEKAIVFAIEDAHFLDTESLLLLDDIAARAPHLSVLVILAGAVDTLRLDHARTMRLGPLDREALATILEERAPQFRYMLAADERDWLCTVASGNPGHLELLLSSSALQGQLRIPLTLLALTDERIASLSQRSQHALCAIAVIGSDCAVDTLSSVWGMEPYVLLQALEELENRFLIVCGPGGIRCRSLLIQERILAVVPGSVKQLLHARAARFVQRVFRSGSFSQAAAWRIAEHWIAAGSADRARHWQRRSWRHAIAIGKPASAILGIQSALSVAQSPKERAALLEELSLARRSQGDIAGLYNALTERIQLCDQCEDSTAIRTTLAFDLLEASLRQHDDDVTHVAALRSFVIARELDVSRRVRAARFLIISAHNLLDERLAAEAHQINVSLQASSQLALLTQKSASLIFHTVFGDRDQAMCEADELTSLVARSPVLSERVSVLLNVNLARWHVDARALDIAPAEKLFNQGIEGDAPAIALHLASQTASFLLEDGRLAEAREWAQRAHSIHACHRFDRLPMDYLCVQSHLAMLDGRVEDAKRLIDSMPVYAPKCKAGMTNNAVFVWNVLYKRLCLDQRAAPEDLLRLRSYHLIAQAYGKHDYHVEALWMALVDAGQRTEAHEMLGQYFEVRRERRAPNYTLRLRTADDPYWRSSHLPILAPARAPVSRRAGR